jgi:hypothetical protein
MDGETAEAYYPLLTLGAEQLLRVVEGAIAYEFKDKGGPGIRRTFQKRIDWLASTLAGKRN